MITEIESEDIAMQVVRGLKHEEIDAIANGGLFDCTRDEVRTLARQYGESPDYAELLVLVICVQRAGGLTLTRLGGLCDVVAELDGQARLVGATELWNLIDHGIIDNAPLWAYLATRFPELYADPNDLTSYRLVNSELPTWPRV